MTSMIKNTNAEGWIVVAEVYGDCLAHSGKGLTFVNRIIYMLVQRKSWGLLQLFMGVYHFVMRDR